MKFNLILGNKSCNNEFLLKQVDSIVKKECHDVNRFIRKGKVGGYKDEMSEEYVVKFDKWMNDNET